MRERFLSCIRALERSDSRADVGVPAGAPADCSSWPQDHGQEIIVPGFAVMALCCLLIEALRSFREQPEPQNPLLGPCTCPTGPCIHPQPSTTEAFKKFLRLPAFRGEFDCPTVSASFVRGVRNGILHEAETRRWAIWREEPKDRLIEPEGRAYGLNRTAFHAAIVAEFEGYVRQLRDRQNVDLRKRFLKKMDDIVKEC